MAQAIRTGDVGDRCAAIHAYVRSKPGEVGVSTRYGAVSGDWALDAVGGLALYWMTLAVWHCV